jgi:hypothetical protein
MKVTPHITEEDTIRIVRIVIKCSDLLSDFDTLEEYMIDKKSKFIRQEVKAPFVKLGEYVDKFSSAFLKSFVATDDIVQMELQAIFSEFSNKIFIIDEETTALGMLYSKAKSICDDVSEMKYSDKRLQLLYKSCNDFVKIVEKKYPLTLLKTDPNGHCIYDVAEALTRLGKTIMYGKKPGDV